MLKKILPILVLFSFATVAQADTATKDSKAAWTNYDAPKFGFKMSVPAKTKMKAKAIGKWGGFHARIWPAQLWGLAKLDKKHTPGEIAAFGLIVTKTKAKHWKEIAEGKDKQGFEWFKIYKAEAGNHVAIAVTGVGPKGSYILVLKTLKTNYLRFQAAYDRWAASVTVY